jgi:hypothetical protein
VPDPFVPDPFPLDLRLSAINRLKTALHLWENSR